VVLRMVCLYGCLNCCPSATCFSGWFACMVVLTVVQWLLFTRQLCGSQEDCLDGYLNCCPVVFVRQICGSQDGLPERLSKLLSNGC
jgi:hypothetical protein